MVGALWVDVLRLKEMVDYVGILLRLCSEDFQIEVMHLC
jgi:hypothetical protein